MLNVYVMTGSTANEAGTNVVNKLNELFADDDNVSFSLSTTNIITMTGKLWNSLNVTNVNTYNSGTYYRLLVDMEEHFLALQINVSGLFGGNVMNSTIGTMLYCEDSEGNPFGYIGGSSLCTQTLPPYCLGVNIAQNISPYSAFNKPYVSSVANTYDMGDEFDLVPLYIGCGKPKKMYVCNNNKCAVGRKVYSKDKTYVCIGEQIFYEM